MTREETLMIMSVLKAAYPAYYKDMRRSDAESVVALWSAMFAREDYALVNAAVQALIETDVKGYPPHIGAVKQKIQMLTRPADRTAVEAWALVESAAKNSTYDSEKEFEKLPPVIRRLVGSPSQLKEWAMMDADTFKAVIGSNFQRSYKEAVEREAEIDRLPEQLRTVVQKLSENNRLMIGDRHGV